MTGGGMGDILLPILGGLIAGVLGGLLGIGGGVVLMPFLRFVMHMSPPLAAANCVVAVFFTTLGGGYRHYRFGHVELRSILPVLLAGLVSTAVCSILFALLVSRSGWIDLGLGLVFLVVSLRMIFDGLPGSFRRAPEGFPSPRVDGALYKKIPIGTVAGALPGLLGIGAGGVLVPSFTFLLKTSIKTAAAASLICFCLNAAVSAGFKYSQGYVDVKIALLLSLGTFVGANLGAVISRRFPSPGLKLLFGLVFAFVSLKFILSFVG
jgi:uncharacterized membrane protein YfcA